MADSCYWSVIARHVTHHFIFFLIILLVRKCSGVAWATPERQLPQALIFYGCKNINDIEKIRTKLEFIKAKKGVGNSLNCSGRSKPRLKRLLRWEIFKIPKEHYVFFSSPGQLLVYFKRTIDSIDTETISIKLHFKLRLYLFCNITYANIIYRW